MPGRFDPEVLDNDPVPRRQVLGVLAAALDAVDPGAAVRRHLARVDGRVLIGDHEVPEPTGRVILLALGKAAVAMAGSAVAALEGLPIVGAVAAPTAADLPGLEVVVGGHPLPDEGSVRAGRLLLDLAGSAGPDDLVLALISGGGSALAEVPLPGVALADLRALGIALLRAGAPIAEVNVVRRHLSSLKGGGLSATAGPAPLASLIVSDVVGNPLEVIAGGPTVPDPTSPRDALRVLADRGIRPPAVVEEVLQRRSARREEPLAARLVAVIADGAVAAAAARAEAEAGGVAARVVSTSLEGEAAAVGRDLAAAGRRLPSSTMLIHAGETTVTVSGGGIGGRNQELALAAGIALEDRPGILVAGFGTDGVDGPSGAAGGIGDAGTVPRGRRLGRDARAALADNDSAAFLQATGDQLRCGPTGTNVGDLMVVYRAAG